MPTETTSPTHVLTTDAVRWSINTLGAQQIDPAFIYYLYLRQQWIEGTLAQAAAGDQIVKDLIRMPGGPPGKPYYRPLRERGDRTGELLATFWLQSNLAGSWSPASLKRLTRAGWLVDDAKNYTIPDDHVARAKESFLFGKRVPVMAMGAFFLRNDGVVLDHANPVAEDLVTAFRMKFLYDDSREQEFVDLFDATVPEVNFDWFEPAVDEESSDA